jgi:hypothetical protein
MIANDAPYGIKLTRGLIKALAKFARDGCDVCSATKMIRASINAERAAATTLDKGKRGFFDAAGPMPVASAQFNYRYA